MNITIDALLQPDQLLWRSQANATALILGSISLLKKRQIPIADWFLAWRQLFSPSWGDLAAPSAHMLMTLFVANAVSVGARCVALHGGNERAEGVIDDWPTPEALAMLDLSLDDLDGLWDALAIGATYHGFSYRWARQERQITLVLHRTNPAT
jgi:hypothetical protein